MMLMYDTSATAFDCDRDLLRKFFDFSQNVIIGLGEMVIGLLFSAGVFMLGTVSSPRCCCYSNHFKDTSDGIAAGLKLFVDGLERTTSPLATKPVFF